MVYRNFFKINESTDIFDFGDFAVPETVHFNKTINKMWTEKDQGNFEHRFGDNCLTNNLVKFLQDRIKP